MSKQNGEVRLPKPFEALLAKWPEPERDESFWDDNAEKVSDRLEGAKAESAGSSALLEPPLPAEPDEGTLGEAADEPPPRSLLEIARMSLESDSKPDSSDIAKESLSMATKARVSTPMLAEATRAQAATVAAGMLAASSPASTESPPMSAPPPSAPVARAAVPSAAPTPIRPKRSAVGPLVMAGLGLVGLAAAAMIVVRAQRQEAAPVAMVPAAAPMASAAPSPTAEPPKAPGEEIVELGDLGSGKTASAEPKPGAAKEEKLAAAKPSKGEPSSAGAVAKAPEPPTTAEAKAEPKPPEKDEEGAKMKPAATAGDVPEKPSSGAVQAAVGSVMGGARACVAGQDAASRATVTFGSDGRVTSVAVSGPAAGTPAEACIKAALSKARVQAFARPSFSVGVTVRP